MLFKSIFFRAASALCLALAMTVFAFGDTIRLKDGSIIKGKIVSFGGGKFVVLVGEGTRQRQLNYSTNEIESIAFDTNSMSTTGINSSTDSSIDANKNSTKVITVGQNTSKPTDMPVSTSKNTTVTAPKPIEIGVKVLADNTSNGWTNSGWVVRKGQRIRITGTGRVSLGGGRYTTPGGIASLADKNKLMANESTGALIAVVGDNNNDFIFIGDSKEFVATHDGALFLGVNEGNLDDNSGAFDVKIEIDPEIGY